MKPLSIQLFQTDIVWENKHANLAKLETWLSQYQQHQSHITILPEMFTTGFTMNAQSLSESIEGKTIQTLKKLSAQFKTIIAGSLIIQEQGKFYNRFVWVMPNEALNWYDKRHLFSLADEHQTYAAGSQRIITQVNQWKILLLVCYDIRFPVWCRQQQPAEYDIMIVVANWPAIRDYAWMQLLIARAIENQCYVVAVNRTGTDGKDIRYTGNSLIIDPLGTIINSPSSTETAFHAILDKQILSDIRERFPFLKDKDDFVIV
jgi:Predicted amidohydrolase